MFVFRQKALRSEDFRFGVKFGVVVQRKGGHLDEGARVEVNAGQGGAFRGGDSSLQADDIRVLSKAFLDHCLQVGGVAHQRLNVLRFGAVSGSVIGDNGGDLGEESVLHFRVVGELKEGHSALEGGSFEA